MKTYTYSVHSSLVKAKGFLLTALLVLFAFIAQAQVGIGTTTPDGTAQLDIQATGKGLLIPRMLDTDRTGISNPAPGLLVYQTNAAKGFYYYDGSTWLPLLYTPPVAPGFSVAKETMGVTNTDPVLNSYSTTLYSVGTGLNTSTGIYTVPESGTYRISAVVNYSTTAALTVSLGAGVNPRIGLIKNDTDEVLTGLFPILNVNVALVLTLRAILGSGNVVISGDIPLVTGDQIKLQYISDGLNVNLDLGVTDADNGIVWSVRKL